MQYYMNGDSLYHHGILGMKWGVRRYQNKDGTLTDAGKKRIDKKYRKAIAKTMRNYQKNWSDLFVSSHNKAADYFNDEGGTDKFNAAQEKKYGKKYMNRPGYLDDYQQAFDKKYAAFMNTATLNLYNSNKSFHKAQALVKKYDMTKWNDFAKENEEIVTEMKKVAERVERG